MSSALVNTVQDLDEKVLNTSPIFLTDDTETVEVVKALAVEVTESEEAAEPEETAEVVEEVAEVVEEVAEENTNMVSEPIKEVSAKTKLGFLGKPIKPRVEEARKDEEEMKTFLKSAVFQLEEELIELYTAPDEDGNSPSEEELSNSQQNAEHIRKLIEHFLVPIIFSILSNTTQLKLQTKNLKIQSFNQQKISATETNSNTKKKTSWSIYLSEIAKNLPGWKEATSKLTFASAEYKKLSQQEKDQIVIEYFTSRNLPLPGKNSTTQKVTRVSGLDAFRKHWYEERKKTNPEAKGLDSLRCTTDWKALSETEQNEWKELRRQQVEGV